MDYEVNYINPEIKISCYQGKLFKTEAAFDDHLLVWLISGETRIIQSDHSFTFEAGSTFMIPRNHLATIMNTPKDGLPHKAVAMHLSIERLRRFYTDKEIRPKITADKIVRFAPHPLLQSCLTSLIPYFELKDSFPEEIATLKITEAISIIRSIDKDIDAVLANFDDPHKMDISAFMEKNFMFNMPLRKFGYLSGRSLSTFKRDFFRAFQTTPQRWLTQRRLELAHYQLAEKQMQPIDVFYETGFENLSHFSYVFKKKYGYAPTALPNQLAQSTIPDN